MMSDQKVKHLVADTGAFLANSPLHEMAEKVYTVTEVLAEVKSRSALDRLQVLPYELEICIPEEEDRKVVQSFARKTGDLGSLSHTDMEVLALAVYLERRQHNGSVDHLNKTPKRMHFVGKPTTVQVTTTTSQKTEDQTASAVETDDEWTNIKPNTRTHKKLTNEDHSSDNSTCKDGDAIAETEEIIKNDQEDVQDESEDEPEQDHDDGHEEFFDDEEFSDEEAVVSNVPSQCNEEAEKDLKSESDQTNRLITQVDSNVLPLDGKKNKQKKASKLVGFGFGGDWISPSNLEQVRRQMSGVQLDEQKSKSKKALSVAIISNDFSLQNVGLQLGLKLLSVGRGLLIRRSRQSALRCIACFHVTMASTRMFCPQCGNLKTLKKVCISIDSNGQRRLHLNPRRPVTSRDKKLCIPRPRRGKHALNPILAPDQHVPKIKPSQKALADRKAVSESVLKDDGYLIRDNPFAVNDVYSSASRHLRTGCRAAAINQMVFNEGRKHANHRKDKRRN